MKNRLSLCIVFAVFSITIAPACMAASNPCAGVEIIEVTYGTDTKRVNVTDRAQEMIKKFEVPSPQLPNTCVLSPFLRGTYTWPAAFSLPVEPGVKKTIKFKYKRDGIIKERTVVESTTISTQTGAPFNRNTQLQLS